MRSRDESVAGVPARAVLVHGGTPMWRRALRERLLTAFRADASTNADSTRAESLVVLLSSRDAEAAKWLTDPRLVLVVAADDGHLRATVTTLAPAVDVLWLGANAGEYPMDALVGAIVQRLLPPDTVND